ncbi:flagellar basal body-associated FliL family protein [Planococcus lenghuensis]|uniref:Flagellar protein FliL n=1 Tax=Planococcus lenghuensis TaxID=2213202 RepID=A0A1Q2L194_9BACL|nr:flagellar basal body-associated FliL family protein [Planococcus lenghuensis]AQQ54144.1 flagellar basal body-associated protein FliL [Planococcus lenghuensis]
MKNLKVIFGALAVILIIGAGAFVFFGKNAESAAKHTGVAAEELAVLSTETDTITTNLANPDSFAVVRFNILLSNKKAKEETDQRAAEVRAAAISTLAGFSKEQLIGVEGIDALEQQLTLKLESIMETGTVERVLVTEFKVQ